MPYIDGHFILREKIQIIGYTQESDEKIDTTVI